MAEMDDNRYVAEKLGICWHEITARDDYSFFCSCGEVYAHSSSYICSASNPDFRTDPARLLREMMKRDDWYIPTGISFAKRIGMV